MQKIFEWIKGHKTVAGVSLGLLAAAVYALFFRHGKNVETSSRQAAGMVYSPPASSGGGTAGGEDNGRQLAAVQDLIKESQASQTESQKNFLNGITDALTGQGRALTDFMTGVKDNASGRNKALADFMTGVQKSISGLTSKISSAGISMPDVPGSSGIRQEPNVYIEPQPSQGSRSGGVLIQPVGGVEYGKSGFFGNSGQGTEAEMKANEIRLSSDPAYHQNEITRTLAVIANRSQAGLDTSVQKEYLTRLRG